jgi:hypothetical protein
MAQFKRSIQSTGFRPEQVSDKNVSQLQAYSERIANALREERDAVISNRNRTADALKENAQIESQQLSRDANIQQQNIQTQIKTQEQFAEQERRNFETRTQASQQIFGTLSTLSTSAALKLQEIEVERFKEKAISDYAEVMTLGDNSPKVKQTEALAAESQAEEVTARAQIADAELNNGLPTHVADKLNRNINELSFGAKVARLHQLMQKYPSFLNEKFMDGTTQYTLDGKTFTAVEAANDRERTSIVSAAALKQFMDVNGVTGLNAGFLQKSGFLPGILSVNQGAIKTAEKAGHDKYKVEYIDSVGNQLAAAENTLQGQQTIESNWPEMVRLLGYEGALNQLTTWASTVTTKGDTAYSTEAIFAARIGQNGEPFGNRVQRRNEILQKQRQALNADAQARDAEGTRKADDAFKALEPQLREQLRAAAASGDMSILATAEKEIYDLTGGYRSTRLAELQREVEKENKQEAAIKAERILDKIRTGQATPGDIMSVEDRELRSQLLDQYNKTQLSSSFGPDFKDTLKMAESAAKQIMGDSLEGPGGLEAQRLASVMKAKFKADYQKGLALYGGDTTRAEQYALDRLEKDKDAAMLNQDKNSPYYSTIGPGNKKVFPNVRAMQAQTTGQQNEKLRTLRETLGTVGLRALDSPGILGSRQELENISQANMLGQTLQFTPQIKEAAKRLGITELEATNQAINAFNKTSATKIPPLVPDITLQRVNDARPETRALFTNNPTLERIRRGTAEIEVTPLRDPGNMRGSFKGLPATVSSGEGGWNSVNRGYAGDTPGGASAVLGRNLTDLTFAEVEKAQSKNQVFAVGAYQFTPGVLARARREARLPANAPMTPENQTKAFWGLAMGDPSKPSSQAKRPKLAAYLRGESNDLNAAQLELSMEWAGVVGPSGRGYYDGDKAGNRASVESQRVRESLIAARKQFSGK